VIEPSELRELAEGKILAASGLEELGPAGRAATVLLTDLYRAGLRHGITPQDWAAVAALPTACWDATVAAIRVQQVARDHAVRSQTAQAGVPKDGVQAPEPFLPGPPRRPQPRHIGRGR
jgi:hypothetical protein